MHLGALVRAVRCFVGRNGAMGENVEIELPNVQTGEFCYGILDGEVKKNHLIFTGTRDVSSVILSLKEIDMERKRKEEERMEVEVQVDNAMPAEVQEAQEVQEVQEAQEAQEVQRNHREVGGGI